MGYETIDVNVEDGIARVFLNRPEVLNSMSATLLSELLNALRQFSEDSEIKVVMITGRGRGFCAGADLGDQNTEKDPEKMRAQGRKAVKLIDELFNPITSTISHMNKPVVVAVNGVAAGAGMGIALAADIVIAAESATFKQVFIPKLGILPDAGCTWTLPRLVGKARTLGLTLLGDSLPAKTAKEWGLIWEVYADEELEAQTDALCTRLSELSCDGVAAMKYALNKSYGNTLDEQLALESKIQGERNSSEDFLEGVNAFLEKREPVFNK